MVKLEGIQREALDLAVSFLRDHIEVLKEQGNDEIEFPEHFSDESRLAWFISFGKDYQEESMKDDFVLPDWISGSQMTNSIVAILEDL